MRMGLRHLKSVETSEGYCAEDLNSETLGKEPTGRHPSDRNELTAFHQAMSDECKGHKVYAKEKHNASAARPKTLPGLAKQGCVIFENLSQPHEAVLLHDILKFSLQFDQLPEAHKISTYGSADIETT